MNDNNIFPEYPTFQKDPAADLDYAEDWSRELNGGTIASVNWIAPTGITVAAQSHTSTHAIVRLAGGARGHDYRVTCEMTPADGQTDRRSIVIQVRDR